MQTEQFLNPQLGEIKIQLDVASQKAVSIVNGVDFEQLNERPQPDKWSIAECLVHLNRSSQAEIDVINSVFERTEAKKVVAGKQFKMDLLGRLLKWTLGPPPMFFSKMKTTKPFQPAEIEPASEILPTFLALQERLKACVDTAAGLSMDQVKVVSPFDKRVKYNLFSFFHILLAHERRHLWQAEKVKEAIQ